MAAQSPKTKKRPLLPQILCGLLLSFTLFVFAPVDMYLLNSSNFWFDLTDFVPVFLALFAVSFAVIEGIYLLLRKLPYPAYLLLLSGLFGLAMLVYVQGNYLCLGNEVLFGGAPVWNEMLAPVGINLLIWLAVLLACAVLILLRPKIILRVISIACALVLVMEGSALVVSVANHRSAPAMEDVYCSNVDQFTYSHNGDVLVYMIDTLDARLVDRMLDEDWDFVSEFDGFTYYHNASSSYCMTDPSFASMLTGELCLNEEPFFVYCQRAFENSAFFPTLVENGMTVNVYGAPSKILSGVPAGQVDNLRVRQSGIRSYKEFIGMMMKMVGYRYAPQFMQPFLFDQYAEAFSDYQQYAENADPETIQNDFALFTAFNDSGVTIDNSRRFFKFYAMQGAHKPFLMNRYTEWVKYTEQYEQTLGVFTMLEAMFEELKEKGVYDTSTIIVVGDHGINDEDDGICSPAFLVKYPHETSDGELLYSEAPVSLLDLRATVLYGAGMDYSAFGKPVNLWEETEERDRLFYLYEYKFPGGMEFYLNELTEYIVPQDAADLASYEPTGNVYR